eukprot:1386052-Rhodomonas_salina.1
MSGRRQGGGRRGGRDLLVEDNSEVAPGLIAHEVKLVGELVEGVHALLFALPVVVPHPPSLQPQRPAHLGARVAVCPEQVDPARVSGRGRALRRRPVPVPAPATQRRARTQGEMER